MCSISLMIFLSLLSHVCKETGIDSKHGQVQSEHLRTCIRIALLDKINILDREKLT